MFIKIADDAIIIHLIQRYTEILLFECGEKKKCAETHLSNGIKNGIF